MAAEFFNKLSMAKTILTSTLLAAGVAAVASAIATNADGVAQEIISVFDAREAEQKQLDELKNLVSTIEKERDAALANNKNLQTKIEKLSAKAKENADEKTDNFKSLSFTYEEQKYGFAFPQINLGGTIYTASDVVADVAIQKRLVETKSGMLVKK